MDHHDHYFSDNLATTSAVASAPPQLDDESLHEKPTRLLHRRSNASLVNSIQPERAQREAEDGWLESIAQNKRFANHFRNFFF